MKKFYLCLLLCSMSLFAMGQGSGGWFNNYSESLNTGYYSFQLFNNSLFPDSTVKVMYGSSVGGVELDYVSTHDIGEVFDPKSYMYTNQISSKSAYKVDSIALPYLYNYVKEAGAAPDTLVFRFFTGVSNGVLTAGTFAANPSYGIPQEPYATIKYNYIGDKGVGEISEVKYILKQSDTATTTPLNIVVATRGASGVIVKANDLFAYTVSYRPGYKYKLGDTIDERWTSPVPKHLHSHFRFFEGLSTTKAAMDDYEQALTVLTPVRYNKDVNWDGYFVPGTAWFAYNEMLWTSFHAEVLQNAIYNDAGINSIVSPSSNICPGPQPVKVRLENYGHKKLTSATINWAVNGNGQTAYTWSGSLDSGYTEVVILNTGYNFKPNTYNTLYAYTTFANGIKDSVSGNDSANTDFFVSSLPQANAGSAANVCKGNSATIGAGGVGGDTYSWTSTPVGFTSNSPNPTVSPGTSTVYTLTETDGNTGCSNSNSVFITVLPLPNASWTVSNVQANYGFKVKDSALALSAYTWDFGDGTSKVNGYDQVHVFPKNKSYSVKLTVINPSTGCLGELDSALNVTISGIEQKQFGNLGFNAYPNPVTEKLNLKFKNSLNEPVNIIITDQLGRVVHSEQVDGKQTDYELNVAMLAKGLYTLNLQTASNGAGKIMFVKD